ncbi:tyrosine-type recombinase/integrase [Tetragenococcus halophilus]
MEGIYKDKKTGKWYFTASLGFDGITGKRIQKKRMGFRTQKEANAARTELLKEYHEMGKISHSNMSYFLFMEEIYIPEYKARVEESTFISRGPVLNQMRDYFGKKKVSDINALQVQQWKKELLAKYSQNYARLLFGMFRKSLDMAVSLNIIKKNVSKQVEMISKEKKMVQYWTKEDFEKVVRTFDVNDYYEHYCFVMVWLYFMTGLRVNEATALLWGRDIDFEKKTLTVHGSLRYKTKNDWELGPTKTKAGRRTIALDDDTIMILQDWKKRQEEFAPMQFVLSYDGCPSLKSTINRIVKRHARLAGVPEIQPKGLRHSHASLLINEYNANPLLVKERLGHEDIQTTLGTYGHLYRNVNYEIANRLNGSVKIETAKEKQTKFQGNQSFKYKDKTNSKEDDEDK